MRASPPPPPPLVRPCVARVRVRMTAGVCRRGGVGAWSPRGECARYWLGLHHAHQERRRRWGVARVHRPAVNYLKSTVMRPSYRADRLAMSVARRSIFAATIAPPYPAREARAAAVSMYSPECLGSAGTHRGSRGAMAGHGAADTVGWHAKGQVQIGGRMPRGVRPVLQWGVMRVACMCAHGVGRGGDDGCL